MLTKVKTLKGYTLNSRDGEIGAAREFFFDDQNWVIRYLVADTGNWLTGRQVLISPYALTAVSKEKQQITVDLTKKQIETSPALETDKPVSRQFEDAYYAFYGWPMYWTGPHMWGPYPSIVRDREKLKKSIRGEKAWDPHLRSTHDVSGHYIQALEGELGHVDDFIIDDETWAIRYLVIDTQNWWPGKKVMVSPQWIDRISWSESKVFINLSRDAIKIAPEYSEESLITRDYESALHKYYNKEVYWHEKSTQKEHSAGM
ncbi:MAG: PRC-barrel domain-containing protein [Candidatus Riflebacteria bacterium]|nr:PRC-barrel domain-containing protein [Candidatus Riflebacteria bacterium]